MEKMQFNTPYITRYTKPEPTKKENEFVTSYTVKTVDTVISIETRPKKKRFKSQLVEK